jgi:hypothetical protein
MAAPFMEISLRHDFIERHTRQEFLLWRLFQYFQHYENRLGLMKSLTNQEAYFKYMSKRFAIPINDARGTSIVGMIIRLFVERIGGEVFHTTPQIVHQPPFPPHHVHYKLPQETYTDQEIEQIAWMFRFRIDIDPRRWGTWVWWTSGFVPPPGGIYEPD